LTALLREELAVPLSEEDIKKLVFEWFRRKKIPIKCPRCKFKRWTAGRIVEMSYYRSPTSLSSRFP
jgi:hypothetical protein